MQHPKLNQTHDKWVEHLYIFTFVLKHISDHANIIVDALSRSLIIQEGQIQVMGFEFLKEIYEHDEYF